MRGKYKWLVFIGLAVNLIETWLFGWHWHAQSGAESFWDTVSLVLVGWGIIGDLFTNLRIHKHYHVVNNTRVHTKEVQVTGDNQKIVYHTHYKVAQDNKPKKEAK